MITWIFTYSENQKTCRGDDYLRIKGPGGKQKFYCGQADSQLDEEVTFQQMGPWGKDKKVHFSFRFNNDEENRRRSATCHVR